MMNTKRTLQDQLFFMLVLTGLAMCVLTAGRSFAQEKRGTQGFEVFCRLEALALRNKPSNGGFLSGSVVKFNEKLVALKRWKHWILVRIPSQDSILEGWVRQWHISPSVMETDEMLTDLSRILLTQNEKGELIIEVEDDVYCDLRMELFRKGKKLEARLVAEKNIFMSECRHYFFDIRTPATKGPTFILSPGETFTPENMTIYQIMNKRPVKIGMIADSSLLSGKIPESSETYGPTKGIAIRYHDKILGTDEAYSFLWLEHVDLGKWSKGSKELERTQSLRTHFGSKLLGVTEIPPYMMVVDSESGKSGWLETILICKQDRISLLKDKKLVPKSVMIINRGHKKGEFSYRTHCGSVIEDKTTWRPLPGEYVTFDSKETIDELRDDGQLPKGLYEAEPSKIYLFTENGEFELLP